MEMEYLYEQGEPPRSPPPPYYSLPRQPPEPRRPNLHAPRRKPEVAVYIPSGAPPKYSCEMSPHTEAPAATSRRSSVSSDATLSDAFDLSDPAAAKIDDFGGSSTTNRPPDPASTLVEDANSPISNAEIAGTTHNTTNNDNDSSNQPAALAVTLRRYEILLNAHRTVILAYRTANKTLERELLRSQDLETSAAGLRQAVEEKDRQIAARDARIQALEAEIRKQEEQRGDDEEKGNKMEREGIESLVQAEDRGVPAAEEEQTYSATLEVVGLVSRIAGVLMIALAVFTCLGLAMFGPVEATRQ